MRVRRALRRVALVLGLMGLILLGFKLFITPRPTHPPLAPGQPEVVEICTRLTDSYRPFKSSALAGEARRKPVCMHETPVFIHVFLQSGTYQTWSSVWKAPVMASREYRGCKA